MREREKERESEGEEEGRERERRKASELSLKWISRSFLFPLRANVTAEN